MSCLVAVVIHPREKRSKCSVWPLRGRPDFEFLRYPKQRVAGGATDCVRLSFGGRLLSPADAGKTIIVLDATWRHAARMESDYADVPVRGLSPAWRTAYPRNSKLFRDPDGGLASVEAVYAAYRALGLDTAGLLDHYPWRERFLELNPGL